MAHIYKQELELEGCKRLGNAIITLTCLEIVNAIEQAIREKNKGRKDYADRAKRKVANPKWFLTSKIGQERCRVYSCDLVDAFALYEKLYLCSCKQYGKRIVKQILGELYK